MSRWFVGLVATVGGAWLIAGGKDGAPKLELPDGAELCAKLPSGDQLGAVWAIHARPLQGIDFYFARFDRGGKRVSEPLEIGWGYHAEPTCGLALQGGRFAVVWPHWDDVDNDADLSFARISPNDSLTETRQLEATKLGGHIVDRFEWTGDRFVLRYHRSFDETPQTLYLDADGEPIPD